MLSDKGDRSQAAVGTHRNVVLERLDALCSRLLSLLSDNDKGTTVLVLSVRYLRFRHADQ